MEDLDKRTDKWGYINKEGKIVIKPQFAEAEAFCKGLALVKIKDQKFYVNKEVRS